MRKQFTLKPETAARLQAEHDARRERERPSRMAAWRARIEDYRGRGWQELVETESELFREHYGVDA